MFDFHWWQGHKYWYCDLFRTFIIKGNAKFQLKVHKNREDVFSPINVLSCILCMNFFGGGLGLQINHSGLAAYPRFLWDILQSNIPDCSDILNLFFYALLFFLFGIYLHFFCLLFPIRALNSLTCLDVSSMCSLNVYCLCKVLIKCLLNK